MKNLLLVFVLIPLSSLAFGNFNSSRIDELINEIELEKSMLLKNQGTEIYKNASLELQELLNIYDRDIEAVINNVGSRAIQIFQNCRYEQPEAVISCYDSVISNTLVLSPIQIRKELDEILKNSHSLEIRKAYKELQDKQARIEKYFKGMMDVYQSTAQ